MTHYNKIISTNLNTKNESTHEINEYIYQKRKDEYITSKKMNHYIIKTKMIDWLLKDFGDNRILLDFLQDSFDIILTRLEININYEKYKFFFTIYCNWIYKNSIT